MNNNNNQPTFKKNKTNAGSLRTPAFFYAIEDNSFEPNAKEELVEVYSCFAEIYNPSIKDIEIMNSQGVKSGLTLIIRNTIGQFIPTFDNVVKVDNEFYKDKVLKIVNIAPSDSFIKLILSSD